MSETTPGSHVGEPVDDKQVSYEDLQKMLDEARGRASSLERERDEAHQARQQTERERDTYAGRVVSEQEQRYNTEVTLASTKLASANDMLAAARTAYKAARAEGDPDKEVEAQEAIAKAVSQRDWAQQRKDYLEQNKFAAPPPRQEAADDYAGLSLMPSERSWLSSRPQFRTDPKYRSRVVGASQIAEADGNQRGSDAYFRRIEELIGEGRRESPRSEPEPSESTHRPSSDVAPTRRAQPGAAPVGRVRVELTANQREVADNFYPDLPEAERYEKYFTNLQQMKAQGRM